MRRTRWYPCRLFRHDRNNLDGMVIVQVNGSYIIGTEVFLDDEEKRSQMFISKPRQLLSRNGMFFNGLEIVLNDGGKVLVAIRIKIERLVVPTAEAGLKSQRTLSKYMGVNWRPDKFVAVQLIATSGETVAKDQFDSLNRTGHALNKSAMQGPDFVKLYMVTMRIVLISDASFASSPSLKRQFGYVIPMLDKERFANIINYSSCSCHRASRSVIATEVHALVHAVDMGMLIKETISKVMSQEIAMEAYVDSGALFNIITRNSSTAERRL